MPICFGGSAGAEVPSEEDEGQLRKAPGRGMIMSMTTDHAAPATALTTQASWATRRGPAASGWVGL